MGYMGTSICDEIETTRDCGVVHCHIIEEFPMSLDELAPRFRLLFTPCTYREIGKEQAEKVAKRILHCDLAYDSELMTERKAEQLASRFLGYFEEKDTQYYTNGGYYTDAESHAWHPATYATFDTGILVVAKSRSGCLWVEDED